MLMPKQLLFPAMVIMLLSCNSHHNYAIRDFRKSLQPILTKIVSKGIVSYSDSLLGKMATDEELVQLGQCEHPVLRATAFREMLHRKSFNHFDILMNHLDDTAMVETDGGEFGIWTRTVSDDILLEAGWKTEAEKNKTVERVITKHNYLRSAYTVLLELEPQEKLYPFVKDMATRSRLLSEGGYELGFHDIEYALYGLAKFKKKTDVDIIKKQLLKNISELSDITFRLIKEFPDTAYTDILQTYHRKRFYRFSGDGKDGFTGNDDNRASSRDFIEALISQQNEKSAGILDTILQRLPLVTCVPDIDFLEDRLVIDIWENPAPAYEKLKTKIKNKAEKLLKGQIKLDSVEPYIFPIDSTKENIRWFQ